VPIRVGSSIGTAAGENRGTAGVYLKSSIGVRLLTAAHVASLPLLSFPLTVPRSQCILPSGGAITSPSRLDCIVRVKELLSDPDSDTHQELAPWLAAATRVCGTVQCGRLGVDEEDYREDWALIELQDRFVGKNGIWWWEDILETIIGVQPGTKFTGKVVGVEDPVLGTSEVWFKDGASTDWTEGTLISTEVHLFFPGATFGITESPGVHPTKIERGKVHMIVGTRGGTFATAGDSGSGVFKITQDGRDFVFAGMVLSEFTPMRGPTLTMVAPATRVLAQVAKATGVEWVVAE